jgi:hypothetical protein
MLRILRGCLKSIFWPVPNTNSCGGKGLKPLVYVDHWSVQSSNFGFSDIFLGDCLQIGGWKSVAFNRLQAP